MADHDTPNWSSSEGRASGADDDDTTGNMEQFPRLPKSDERCREHRLLLALDNLPP